MYKFCRYLGLFSD